MNSIVPQATDLALAAPLLAVATWTVLLLAIDAFAQPGPRRVQRRLTILGVGIAALLAAADNPSLDAGRRLFEGFLVVDRLTQFVDLAALGIAAGLMIFARDDGSADESNDGYGELEPLILMCTFGVMLLGHANGFVPLLLGLELVALPMYILVAGSGRATSAEGAMKSILVGLMATAILVMGVALLYGACGTLSFDGLSSGLSRVLHEWRSIRPHVVVATDPYAPPTASVDSTQHVFAGWGPAALLLPGILLIAAGLLFKLGAAPFHLWLPDAIQACSPGAAATILGLGRFGAVVAALKVFVGVLTIRTFVVAPYGWTSAVAFVALLSLVIGNFGIVLQSNTRRLFALSSVAHLGYLLLGLVAAGNVYGAGAGYVDRLLDGDRIAVWSMSSGDDALAAVLYEAVAYAVATIGAWAGLASLGRDQDEPATMDAWAGLGLRRPRVAFALSIVLLSWAGIPPMAGFVGRLSLLRSALANDNFAMRLLVLAAGISSVVGVYGYLRILIAMYARPSESSPRAAGARGPLEGPRRASARVTVALAAIVLIAGGVAADRWIVSARRATAGVTLQLESNVRETWVLRER